MYCIKTRTYYLFFFLLLCTATAMPQAAASSLPAQTLPAFTFFRLDKKTVYRQRSAAEQIAVLCFF